ncbi:MAG: hypothetical protein QOH46_4218 [Solirubrobacteraceae bacterium]|jgi:uncharacterized protein YkwD|nr:hypothetical protein [Solirubrobacteraceae bacterium]
MAVVMALLRFPTLILFLGVAAIVVLALAAPSNAAAAGGCAGVQASVAQVSPRVIGGSVLCLVNTERTTRGLPALRQAARLRLAAARYSREMVARQFFDHVSPSGSTLTSRVRRAGYRGGTLGENIGWGTGALATPVEIVRAWMASPPHRAVILNRRYREGGVGVASGSPLGAPGPGATFVLDVGTR